MSDQGGALVSDPQGLTPPTRREFMTMFCGAAMATGWSLLIVTRRTCPRGTPPNCRPIAFKYQPKYGPQPRPQQTLR